MPWVFIFAQSGDMQCDALSRRWAAGEPPLPIAHVITTPHSVFVVFPGFPQLGASVALSMCEVSDAERRCLAAGCIQCILNVQRVYST